MEYEALRKLMVQEQLYARGIKDARVLNAFEKIERHKFLPEESRASAYADSPIPIGEGQTISQPYMAALMTQCLKLNGRERVLEIGTGSGYQTAILAELAKEVYTIERFAGLAKRSAETLREAGYENIKTKLGDGTLGWPEKAPFERIIIAAATPRVPLPLIDQLKDRGKMVLPLEDTSSQILTIVEKNGNKLDYTEVCACVFVPLVGKYGYNKEP